SDPGNTIAKCLHRMRSAGPARFARAAGRDREIRHSAWAGVSARSSYRSAGRAEFRPYPARQYPLRSSQSWAKINRRKPVASMPRKPEILKRTPVCQSRLFRVESLDLRFSNGAERTFERMMGGGLP